MVVWEHIRWRYMVDLPGRYMIAYMRGDGGVLNSFRTSTMGNLCTYPNHLHYISNHRKPRTISKND